MTLPRLNSSAWALGLPVFCTRLGQAMTGAAPLAHRIPTSEQPWEEVGPILLCYLYFTDERQRRPLASILEPPIPFPTLVLTVIKKKNQKTNIERLCPVKFLSGSQMLEPGSEIFLQRTGGKYCRFFGPRYKLSYYVGTYLIRGEQTFVGKI